MNIQELELSFGNTDAQADYPVGNFHFKQKFANEFGYIYEVTDPSADAPHYEVFERIVVERFDFENKCAIPDEFKVRYPTADNFGEWAWTTKSYDRAINILGMIKQYVEYRKSNGLTERPEQTLYSPIDSDVEEGSFEVGPE